MSFDFLLPIVTYPDPTPKEGLVRAVDMVASITGRLSAVVQELTIPPIHNALAELLINVSAMSAEAEQRSRATGLELSAEVDHIARRMAVPHAVRTHRVRTEEAVDRMVAESRRHDATLFVLDPKGAGQSELAEAILFGSGGPLLLCPGHDATGHLRTAALAWDGSRSAARAVRDALPVLARAETVIVLTVDDDKPVDVAGLDGLRELLAYHGIDTQHRNLKLEGRSVGDTLQMGASFEGAGLLVMGAFGHNRLREFVVGGATQSVLNGPRLPVFLSH